MDSFSSIISNILAENTGNAIFIRLGHRGGEKPGVVRNIRISDVKVEVPFIRPDINYELRALEVRVHHNPFPASIVGIPGHFVQDIELENIQITYPGRASKGKAYIPLNRLKQVPEKIGEYPEFSMFGELPSWGFYVRHAKGISMRNITLSLEDKDFRPAFVFDDVVGIDLDQINLPKEKKTNQIILKDVSGFKLNPLNENLVKTVE